MENKVKELRKGKSMTQEELAKKAGISRSVLSGIENGTRDVATTETLRKISKALGAEITEVFF